RSVPLTFRDILQVEKIGFPAYPVGAAKWTSKNAFRSLFAAGPRFSSAGSSGWRVGVVFSFELLAYLTHGRFRCRTAQPGCSLRADNIPIGLLNPKGRCAQRRIFFSKRASFVVISVGVPKAVPACEISCRRYLSPSFR